MRRDRLPLRLMVALGVAMAVRVAFSWDRLPAVMASHFGAGGVADGWMSRGAFFAVFGLVAGGSCILVAAVPALLRRLPASAVNLPNRDYWLAPERREETLERIAGVLARFALGTTAFLVLVLELTLRANLRDEPLAMEMMWPSTAALLLGSAWLVVHLFRTFRLPPGGRPVD